MYTINYYCVLFCEHKHNIMRELCEEQNLEDLRQYLCDITNRLLLQVYLFQKVNSLICPLIASALSYQQLSIRPSSSSQQLSK